MKVTECLSYKYNSWQVLYVDKDSHSYVSADGRCRFVLRSSDKTSGVLRNPRHSLPPNTSCVYYFQVSTDILYWFWFFLVLDVHILYKKFNKNNMWEDELFLDQLRYILYTISGERWGDFIEITCYKGASEIYCLWWEFI